MIPNPIVIIQIKLSIKFRTEYDLTEPICLLDQLKVMILTHDIFTDHKLASFVQNTPNPNIKILGYKTMFSKMCRPDATKV